MLKNTAKTTSEARPHSSSSAMSTNTSMLMLRMCAFQQVSEVVSLDARPCSLRRLTSYRPMARNGPTSRQPEAIDSVYSGLLRNTAARAMAMIQKHPP